MAVADGKLADADGKLALLTFVLAILAYLKCASPLGVFLCIYVSFQIVGADRKMEKVR